MTKVEQTIVGWYSADNHIAWTQYRSQFYRSVVGQHKPHHCTSNITLHLNQIKPKSAWVILNNQSTVDVFVSPKLVLNIRKAEGEMMTHSHRCSQATNLIRTPPGYNNPGQAGMTQGILPTSYHCLMYSNYTKLQSYIQQLNTKWYCCSSSRR